MDVTGVALGGSTQHVAFNSNPLAGCNSEFTISAWVKLSTAPPWSRVFDFGKDFVGWVFLTPGNHLGETHFSTNLAKLAGGKRLHSFGVECSSRVLVRAGLLVVLVNLVGCGSDDSEDDQAGGCASVVVGEWIGASQADSMSIGADGSFRYSGPDGCMSSGSLSCPDPTLASGTLHVTIDVSGGGRCLPAGNYICFFELNGDSLLYDCTGAGGLSYIRSPSQ